MILTEKEKNFIRNIFNNEEAKQIYADICNKKIREFTDLATFGKLPHEERLSIQEIYSGRMTAAELVKSFAYELFRLSEPEKKKEEKENKSHI